MRLVNHEKIERVAPEVETAGERLHARELDGVRRFRRARRDNAAGDADAFEPGDGLRQQFDAMHEDPYGAYPSPSRLSR